LIRRLLTALAAALPAVGLVPAAQGVPVPIVASANIELLATIPDVGAISTAFDSDEPLMYVNTLNGISIYDISDPALPLLQGQLPMPHFENEAMAVGERLGERKNGTDFVLVGLDLYGVTPTKPDTPNAGGYELIIVDVTDPASPTIRGRIPTTSSVHTIQCVGKACRYAYTSGAYDGGTFHVIDLKDLDNPKEIKALKNVAGEGHQWDMDDAGVLWSSGFEGAAGYDVSDPLNPKPLASTNKKGSESPYNDFIMHNSYHPKAKKFRPNSKPSLANGNVLLVTEEDYDNPVCGGDAGEGTFSTWHIPYLNAKKYRKDNPKLALNRGKMTPLDNWNSEILDSGERTVAGAFCSAHYFTFHDSGFIAQGWYQQGTRILDVRDPKNIKQVGYFFTGDTETWHAYWAPQRDKDGKVTGRDSNVIFTNDVARGIDILKVTLPKTKPGETKNKRAPILPQWLEAAPVTASLPTNKFGYICRTPAGAL
jgi:LVIVD repeat